MVFAFDQIEPNNLWKHFAEFLKIPHCSGNEKALGDYIIAFAESKGLEWKRDDVGNVVISKPGSAGHENAEGVILQGHLDMVCEKNSDVAHDFSKDPISTMMEGEWIRAEGTTLGADNGVGACAALAILEDDSLVHPPIECLFTVDEETGLTGATKIQPGFLKGKKLLNLDSEDEGEFTIGCAGGADALITLPLQKENTDSGEIYNVKLSGFRGGHSGIDINQGRANAIKLLARILWQVSRDDVPFRLVSFEGGNLRNAIPREAWASVILAPSDKDRFSEMSEEAFQRIREEYAAVEKEAAFSIEKLSEPSTTALTQDSQNKLINLLFTLPHGVISMHPEMEGLVETSTNLAVIRTHDTNAEIVCSTRSSVASALQATRDTLVAVSSLVDADVVLEDGYPGWTPNLQSPLLQTMKDIYKKTFHTDAHVAAVHAGLECGIIGEKFPGMDMISFGPTIEHPHSPDERVHVGSVEKFWTFLTNVLSELA
ncbi:MAG: aminoacyl-histidine dipeptidase [Candidatus Aminicenantes bacterium]|jgi:dipeptidase D